MAVFKAAHQYSNLEAFLKDRYIFINGIYKDDLVKWLNELDIPFKKTINKSEMMDLLITNGMDLMDFYNRFPSNYCVIKSDYIEKFGLSNSDYEKLKRRGFLQEVARIESSYSKNGIIGFSAKQFFEMTDEALKEAIPPVDEEKKKRLAESRKKSLTCIRCGEVQSHHKYINKDKICDWCISKEEYELEQQRFANRRLEIIKNCKDFLMNDSYVVLDTETTGLNYTDQIIELAILDMKGDIVYQSLFNPGYEISNEATDVHGISNDDVKYAPTYKDEWPTIYEKIKNKTLLIYNSNFDIKMLKQMINLQSIDIEEFTIDSRCIMNMYSRFIDSERWCKLSDACCDMGIYINQEHRAVGDCMMTIELIRKISECEK